jgi:hypothetical protein
MLQVTETMGYVVLTPVLSIPPTTPVNGNGDVAGLGSTTVAVSSAVGAANGL